MVKKIIKIAFLTFLAAFFAFILVRIFMMDDNRVLKDIYPTESAVQAYSREGESAFTTEALPSKISTDGYYSAYGFVYAESSGEAQITVKYNDSLTKRYLEGATGDDFRWEICDGEGNTVSEAKVLEFREKYQYNYARLSFENVTLDENLFLVLMCDKLSYPVEKNSENFVIHTEGEKLKEYKLSRAEKESLSEKK